MGIMDVVRILFGVRFVINNYYCYYCYCINIRYELQQERLYLYLKWVGELSEFLVYVYVKLSYDIIDLNVIQYFIFVYKELLSFGLI